jgi:hypothetical protein
VPKNAYEFERALQLVRGRPAELAVLLDSLPTRDGDAQLQFGLGALVATALDADFLAELIGALSEVYVPQVCCHSVIRVVNGSNCSSNCCDDYSCFRQENPNTYRIEPALLFSRLL